MKNSFIGSLLLCLTSFYTSAQIIRPLPKTEISYEILQRISGTGLTCSQAVPVCGDYTLSMMPENSSLPKPPCFFNFPTRTHWIAFVVTQPGQLAWTGNPIVSTTEFDWALYDISGGCNGTCVSCNFNYAGGSSAGFGMQNLSTTITCSGSSTITGPYCEYNPPINVSLGKTYALLISNYDNTSGGFTFSFTNSSCIIDCSVGLNNIEVNNEFLIFPNPGINQVYFTSKERIKEVKIYDIAGKFLADEKILNNSISLEQFTEGLYLLRLLTENDKVKFQKLIIQR